MTRGRTELIGLLSREIADERVLEAIAAIPRELFVGASQQRHAYDNRALPIGCGQTISQPLVVARMVELLELSAADRVLEIGTGSGYHAAVLARLAAHVWTVERHAELAEQARARPPAAGVVNVSLPRRRRLGRRPRAGAVRRDQRRGRLPARGPRAACRRARARRTARGAAQRRRGTSTS